MKRTLTLEREQLIEHPRGEVFGFFADALNLAAITPPWLGFEVLTPAPIEMRAGRLIAYRLRLRGVPVKWLTRIEDWQPESGFVDVELEGPYRFWHHTHSFEQHERGTVMRDRVRYELPLGAAGAIAGRPFVAHQLKEIFDYRAQAVAALLV